MLSDLTRPLPGSHGELAVVLPKPPAASCCNGAVFCMRIFKLILSIF